MRQIKIIAVLAVAVIATISLHIGSNIFIAADSALKQVVVFDSGEYRHVLTGASTIAGFAHEMGIPTDYTTRLNHALGSPVQDGMTITVERRIPFYVQVDNNDRVFARSAWPSTTVETALLQLQRENDVAFVYGGDYQREITDSEILALDSLRSRTQIETWVVPYEVYENFTNYVWEGDTHVRQVGSPGEQIITTSVVYIGGVEKNREIVEKSAVVDPVDAIIDIGTGRLGALADVTSPDFHYVRRVRMEATAYTAGFSCTGKHPWDPWYRITASGREVEHGIVAVDRTVIPLGTRLYVEGYGFALAADVGGAIRGYKIDLFMEDIQDARRFGRRHLYVWILE